MENLWAPFSSSAEDVKILIGASAVLISGQKKWCPKKCCGVVLCVQNTKL